MYGILASVVEYHYALRNLTDQQQIFLSEGMKDLELNWYS